MLLVFAAQALGDITQERLGFRWDFPAVGTDFLSWQLHWDGVDEPPQETWLLTMAIGAWDYGSSPTVPLGAVEVLAINYGDLGTQFATWDTNHRLIFSWSMDINDPAFAGFKVAAQGIGLTPAGDFFVSDVTGVVLQ